MWLLVSDGLICWDFPMQPSLGFTLKGMKKSYYLVDKSLGLMGRKRKHWLHSKYTEVHLGGRKCYSSRRPHPVPWAHQSWTINHWKNISWSDKSQFRLWHSDGRIRIWNKQYESVDQCNDFTALWGRHLNTAITEYCAGHVQTFMTLVCPFPDGDMTWTTVRDRKLLSCKIISLWDC